MTDRKAPAKEASAISDDRLQELTLLFFAQYSEDSFDVCSALLELQSLRSPPGGGGLGRIQGPSSGTVQNKKDHPVFAFLMGTGPLEDRWFGDAAPVENGRVKPYWWRKHLRNAFDALNPAPITMEGRPTTEELRQQHLADGKQLLGEKPDLAAAARRALTLLKNIEVDAGEYYRETAWLDRALACSSEPSRAGSMPPSLPLSSDPQSTGWRDAVIEECAAKIEENARQHTPNDRLAIAGAKMIADEVRSLKSPTPIISTGGEES